MNITINIDTRELNKAQQAALGVLVSGIATIQTPTEISASVGSTNDTVAVTVTPKIDATPTPPKAVADPNVSYEYAPKPGRRRSKTDIAMHELEIEHGRRLTPTEKGEVEAIMELGEEEQEAAKVAAKKKARIDKIAAEATQAAAAELAQEAADADNADAEQNDNNDYEGTSAEATEESDTNTDKVTLFDATEDDGIEDTVMPGETSVFAADPEAEVQETPKAEPLDNINSLFS